MGGEGCRHAPGKNWGAPPDALPEAMFRRE